MTRFFLVTAAMLVVTLIGGCASSPQAKFYTLSAGQPREPVQMVRPITINIDAVIVPQMVDRPQFVLRVDPTEVRIDEFARWADPLKSQIARVLAADLTQSMPGALVSSYPRPGADETQGVYHLWVDVQSFESVPGDGASIVVMWSVQPPKRAAAVTGRTVVHEAAGADGNDALVDAHSRALATVGNDIASAIRPMLGP
ncbi:MAG TPA: PqiC family protein [Paraburkholderia sp.]